MNSCVRPKTSQVISGYSYWTDLKTLFWKKKKKLSDINEKKFQRFFNWNIEKMKVNGASNEHDVDFAGKQWTTK